MKPIEQVIKAPEMTADSERHLWTGSIGAVAGRVSSSEPNHAAKPKAATFGRKPNAEKKGA